MPATLSKSTFLRGNQCLKSLYLNWHHPELKDPVSPMQQAIFNQGHDVAKEHNSYLPAELMPVFMFRINIKKASR